jgi:Ohr subfamily peroxiredoxin
MKILMVLTSHDTLGETGRKTGFWLDEFASPFYVFTDAGVEVTLASPRGGQPPIDPKSDEPENQTPAQTRFKSDARAQAALAATLRLDGVSEQDYAAVFYPGGHGPVWDLAEDPDSIRLIESFYGNGKPVVAVCHAPAVLRHVRIDGQPIVKGKRVAGFTNSEEEAVQLTNIVPFLIEDELKRLGGIYEKAGDWQSFVVADGHLITGQNPASSEAAAIRLLQMLGNSIKTIHYTALTHVTGGRVGIGKSSDGALDVQLSTPGSGRPGTNPEQLFGVGYSACFLGAIGIAAAAKKMKLPAETSVDAEVALGQTGAGEWQLAVKLRINLPGLDEKLKRELVDTAHQTCPYSRMTRGHSSVQLDIA